MVIDLRSDTVTKPTAAMRAAMAAAEVGDDGYGEDPTVRRLEELFADVVGKEAALFVPSGTMGNQIALRLLGRPGTAVAIGRRQHPVIYEQGAAGVNGWSQFHLIDDDDGTLSVAAVRDAIEAEQHHWLPVSALCVENTHMPSGGLPWPLEQLREIGATGLPVHLDGARLFNACVATGVSAHDYAKVATTVMCCLSKGLAAPVGSMLGGSRDVIAAARAERKRLGGAMRQAGVIAAAGIVALESMIDRLVDDHRRARRLAHAVAERWPDSGLDPTRVQTNCIVFTHRDTAKLIAYLDGEGVRAGTIAPHTVRFMTHLDVDDAGLERACAVVAAAP
ncbi:MAG TPA: GntG family PLP-dependent aldolase [Acidimicrobiales bacterium]|nr:GntG family PLP-dependent aldolase [Acidimicrobiales bacterium]